MKLPWKRSASKSQRGKQASAPEEQSCASLARVLERILKEGRPEILDLGPFCGDSIVYLAGRGARVSVEEFTPPPPTPPPDPELPEGEQPPKPPLRLEQRDGAFQLVLAWEQLDFVPPDRIAEMGAEIHRVLADGGYVLLLARNATRDEDARWKQRGRYRLLADDRLQREVEGSSERPRWSHPTRAIESALAPLSIKGVQLQRNQVREFLAQKRAR